MQHHGWQPEESEILAQASMPFVHETAIVEENCQLGLGTRVLQYAHIMSNSLIGHRCTISQHATLMPGVFLGNQVQLMPNAYLASGVIIEDNVYCGANVSFEPLKMVKAGRENVSSIQPSLIKRGASIGSNSTIATGFVIGQFAFVQPGATIDQNVPDFAIVEGAADNIVGWRCQCGQLLNFIFEQTSCSSCAKKYRLNNLSKVCPLP